MRWSFLVIVLLPLILWSHGAIAQTIQQDRRIEEEKRDALKPTVGVPSIFTTPQAKPATGPPVPPPLKELYFAQLVQKRVTFGYDAAKVIVILMGVDEEYLDLTSQVGYLQQRGFLPRRLQQSFDPMQPLRKGLAAYLFRQALGIRGGITLHLFGPSERYALKELVFQGFMVPGHVNDLVTGGELVQLMIQAAQHQMRRESRGVK